MSVEISAPAWVPLQPGLLTRDPDGGVTLLGDRCATCGTTYFPALAVCARCVTADALAPVRLSRHGTVYTYSVVHQSTPSFPTPYVLAYVDLPEGVRVLAQIDAPPDAVRTGLPVELVPQVVRPAANDAPEVVGYRFRPREEE